MLDYISLNHGSGGKVTHDLIENLFAQKFGLIDPLTDSAILKTEGFQLAFTTDSYVIDPIFFPGGDIGKLAICGTVNDLAVSGANPRYISASFIIEEGFPIKDLEMIVISMANEAIAAGVMVVTGDTKVVEKGKCDKIFITTSGIGLIDQRFEEISIGKMVKAGDKIIVNGFLGNHAIAILGAREQLGFNSPVISDCASLNHLISQVLSHGINVKFMRDLTRGGLATVLNELAKMTEMGITIDELSIPIEESVKGVCEILGFDPLYLANEGKVIIVVDAKQSSETLEVLRANPLGIYSQIIGEISNNHRGEAVLKTSFGGERLIDLLSGIQLPRIC